MNLFRLIRYRAAKRRRAARLAEANRAEVQRLRNELRELYINAPTRTEARRILEVLWMTGP